MRRVGLALLLLMLSSPLLAQGIGLPAVTVQDSAGGGQTYSVTLQVLILMTALSFLPALVIMMTSFTRIIVVLAILRQGIGAAQTPGNQVLVGLALFLTFFVMAPVFSQIYSDAAEPYMNEEINIQEALQRGQQPLREFMLAQTRESDLALFAGLAGDDGYASPDEVPFSVLAPAFITSELKTAFQIGFLVLIPFLIIDLVVASVLMSMGMVMLSPLIISLPFKLMLFVLVDGWNLIIGTLAASFG